jgi:uncharacterized coiled-coil DUF342 family protein
MPTGIDVGSRGVCVATPDGVTEYANGLRRHREADSETADGDGDGDELGADATAVEVETDDGTYVMDAADPDNREASERLFGTGQGARSGADTALPAAARTALAEAFLEQVADPPDEGPLRYVTARGGADPLAAVATGLGYEGAALDAGMAVCYDVLDAPATGLGVAVTADRAVATLAAAGVPIATATVDLDDDWYDLAGPGAAGGTAERWLARQYETLFAELGADLAASAPAIDGAVPVVVGGSGAVGGEATDGRLDASLTDGLPFDVAAVTVVDEPGNCLARGALTAAVADDGSESPLPAFAVDVPFVGELADFGTATEAFGRAARARPTVDPDDETATEGSEVPGSRPVGVVAGTDNLETPAEDLEGVVTRTRDDLKTLERRGAMTARGLSDVVDRLDDAGDTDGERLAALRADLDDLATQLPDDRSVGALQHELTDQIDAVGESVTAVEADLEQLEETKATAATVTDLESSLQSLEEAVATLEDDIDAVRAAMTGVGEGDVEVTGEGLGDLAVDAIQDDIDELRSEVSDRVDDVWSAVDDLEGRLVDVEATAGDLPDLESTVGSVRNGVADLEDQTADLRESLDSLRSDLKAAREETPSTEDINAVERDIARLSDNVDTLRTELRETEWVEPDTVDELQTDLEGLRQTLITRADRLESLEETTEDLRERIETVYENSAKSEALASLEAETARVRNSAGQAMERTNEMSDTVDELDETVTDHAEQLGMLSTNVDNLAGSSVTRPEMQSSIQEVEDRLDQLEADIRADLDGVRSLADEQAEVEPVEDEGPDLGVVLQTAALVSVGLLGIVVVGMTLGVSGLVSYVLIFAFLVFVIVPGVLSGLVG